MAGREGERKTPRRASSFRTIALLMLLPVAGILLVFLWSFLNQALSLHRDAAAAKARPAPRRVARAAVMPAPRAAASPAAQAAATPAHRGDIVLILDDVGFDRQPLAKAMTIDANVNFAVLPNGNRTAAFADELHARGFEMLCHLPMEPHGFPAISPGAGAVLTSMPDDEIARLTRANIETVRYARGVNNHMGSRATEDRRVMTDVLEALPSGMYFIDSRTTGSSVAAPLARAMGIRSAARNVFLDDVASEPAVRKQLAELARTAASRGVAVGIGHMYKPTIDVLVAEAPKLREQGFRFVRASTAVE